MLCLKVPTDAAWADEALTNVDALLVDHAHCEMKAAANALSLAARDQGDIETAVVLADLAREEIDHFQRVLAELSARAAALGPPPVDAYAADLRRAPHDLPHDPKIGPKVDRFLVAALIEARSCERFKLLARACAARDVYAALGSFWEELFAAEAGHYRSFVELAVRAAGGDREAVAARLDRLADREAAIVEGLGRRAHGRRRTTIHG
jgi:tRNA-(ms[2]io[6]A)-hydroxylase